MRGRGLSARRRSNAAPQTTRHKMKTAILRMPIDEAFHVLCAENPTRDVMHHENGIAIRNGDVWQLCVSRMIDGPEYHVAIGRVLQIGDAQMRAMYPGAVIRPGSANTH